MRENCWLRSGGQSCREKIKLQDITENLCVCRDSSSVVVLLFGEIVNARTVRESR